ncbi:MAG: MBL fold metallo-hydrolase [Dysgonamonadaceae bacterium]|jgi:phosphoribosyl 1,2-cyclic phosphodiesterase|nr:MBL fold metallo-hydrolase [Dysgonamonadaceae bacterium]
MIFRFLSLASGSSGNCYYLGTDSYGVLFDAGVGIRAVKKILKENNIGLEQIMAVFITHAHADHIKCVGSLGEKYDIPVYATELVHEGIRKQKLNISRKMIVEKEKPVMIREFKITAFSVPHDANDCVGYLVDYNNIKWILATDIGHIDETVAKYIRLANHLVVEANYDMKMLVNGNYPNFLKARIMNGKGHLCNSETANFLAANFNSQLKNIWLCHLSKENNRPEIACKTVEAALMQRGIHIGYDVNLAALKRSNPSKMHLLS